MLSQSAMVANLKFTVAEWDSIARVTTETRGRVFQILDRAFSFLLNPQKLDRVFQRLDRIFQNESSAESFDQRTH